MKREEVSVLNQTPSAFRQLMDADGRQGGRKLDSLRLVIFGGEALEVHNLKPWWDRYGDVRPQLVNMYGITETTVHVTYKPLRQSELASSMRGSPIGVPIPDLQVYILEPSGQLAPVGISGEMHVGGRGLARGYLSSRGSAQSVLFPILSANTATGCTAQETWRGGGKTVNWNTWAASTSR